jgi:hypothetical protein
MAFKRPSFLKRQKEIKRVTRALEKREARQQRKETKSTAELPTDTEQAPEEETEMES